MKKLFEIFVILFGILLMASACATRPEVSNHPKHITLAKYRTGDVIKVADSRFKDCIVRIHNIIDDGSDSYYYQIIASCADYKLTKIVPQMYLDGAKNEE